MKSSTSEPGPRFAVFVLNFCEILGKGFTQGRAKFGYFFCEESSVLLKTHPSCSECLAKHESLP